MTCTTAEDCAEWRRARLAMPAVQKWAARRYGSAGLFRWSRGSRALSMRGHVLAFDDAWCPHGEFPGPCAACLRVDSVCPHCSPRRCLTGDDGAV